MSKSLFLFATLLAGLLELVVGAGKEFPAKS